MESREELFIVMELVMGGDLFDRIIERSSYTEADASVLVGGLASALAYLHGMNIVHRDVKPENLMVVQDSRGSDTVKLGDFGLSKQVKEDVRPKRTACVRAPPSPPHPCS